MFFELKILILEIALIMKSDNKINCSTQEKTSLSWSDMFSILLSTSGYDAGNAEICSDISFSAGLVSTGLLFVVA